MLTPQLLDFVTKELTAGISRDDIRKMLEPNGWSEQDISEAFAAVPSVPIAPPRNRMSAPPSGAGKKVALSLAFIITSATYAGWVYLTNNQQQSAPVVASVSTAQVADDTPATPAANSTPPPQTSTATTPAVNPTATTPTQTQPQPAVTPVPQPVPPPKPAGQYTDGTYSGPQADAYYGLVQVQATVSGGKLTNVQFLQYPSDRSTSRYINSQAMPMLTQEAIAAQSANVNIISGATDTSQAFIQSLGAALAQAKA